LFGLGGKIPQIVYPTVVVWGLAFGGFATITQTAILRLAGDSMDVAQSMYTTGWNTAVASGGVVGGVLLDQAGVGSFAWVMLAILVVSFGAVLAMNRAISRQNYSL
jgi:predicted MFS family arabinose efflux permease